MIGGGGMAPCPPLGSATGIDLFSSTAARVFNKLTYLLGALVLLPVLHLSLEMDSAISGIDFLYDVDILAIRRYFTVHAQF